MSTTTATSEPTLEFEMSNGDNKDNDHPCHVDSDSNTATHRCHSNSENNDNVRHMQSNDDNNDSIRRCHRNKSSNNDDDNSEKSQNVGHVIDLPGVAARPFEKPTVTFKLVGITMGVILGSSLLIQVPFRYFYHPQQYLREGNVFTNVCHSFCPQRGWWLPSMHH